MSDSLTDLESGNWIKRGWFILINFLSCNRYDSWGGVLLSVIHTPEENVIVQGPPGLVGGTMSVRWFLALRKR